MAGRVGVGCKKSEKREANKDIKTNRKKVKRQINCKKKENSKEKENDEGLAGGVGVGWQKKVKKEKHIKI